ARAPSRGARLARHAGGRRAPLGARGAAHAAPRRGALQPGDDGSRRDGVHAPPGLRALPAGGGVPGARARGHGGLPRPAPAARPEKHTHMALALWDGGVYLERRPAAGIWGGLWSLPEFAEAGEIADWCERCLGAPAAALEHWEPLRHSFSHYDLDITPVAVRLAGPPARLADTDAAVWYRVDEAPGFGLAAPVKRLIEKVRSDAKGSLRAARPRSGRARVRAVPR